MTMRVPDHARGGLPLLCKKLSSGMYAIEMHETEDRFCDHLHTEKELVDHYNHYQSVCPKCTKIPIGAAVTISDIYKIGANIDDMSPDLIFEIVKHLSDPRDIIRFFGTGSAMRKFMKENKMVANLIVYKFVDWSFPLAIKANIPKEFMDENGYIINWVTIQNKLNDSPELAKKTSEALHYMFDEPMDTRDIIIGLFNARDPLLFFIFARNWKKYAPGFETVMLKIAINYSRCPLFGFDRKLYYIIQDDMDIFNSQEKLENERKKMRLPPLIYEYSSGTIGKFNYRPYMFMLGSVKQEWSKVIPDTIVLSKAQLYFRLRNINLLKSRKMVERLLLFEGIDKFGPIMSFGYTLSGQREMMANSAFQVAFDLHIYAKHDLEYFKNVIKAIKEWDYIYAREIHTRVMENQIEYDPPDL